MLVYCTARAKAGIANKLLVVANTYRIIFYEIHSDIAKKSKGMYFIHMLIGNLVWLGGLDLLLPPQLSSET